MNVNKYPFRFLDPGLGPGRRGVEWRTRLPLMTPAKNLGTKLTALRGASVTDLSGKSTSMSSITDASGGALVMLVRRMG